VLDLAAGCGIAGLAAAAVGAMAAASEIDRFAVAAIRMNAAVNGLDLDIVERDLLGDPVGGHDVILAGDLCYERPMAGRVMSWLRANAAEGALVLLGDPGRAYRPDQGLDELVRYTVPTTRDLEDRDSRETVVWRVLG
jgi:predicted nicotinamide N-methyase